MSDLENCKGRDRVWGSGMLPEKQGQTALSQSGFAGGRGVWKGQRSLSRLFLREMEWGRENLHGHGGLWNLFGLFLVICGE